MSADMRKRIADLIKFAESCGWRVEIARDGHLKWYTPEGRLGASSGSTPGGGSRSDHNLVGKLRRAGLAVPHRTHPGKPRRAVP